MDDNYDNFEYSEDYSECEDISSDEYSSDSDSSDEEDSSNIDTGNESSDGENFDLDILEDTNDSDEDEKDNEKEKLKKYTGLPFLTKFEKTRVLGIRTEQILAGAKIFVETTKTDPYEIALEELNNKKMPFIIRRYFGNKYKDISVNSLIII